MDSGLLMNYFSECSKYLHSFELRLAALCIKTQPPKGLQQFNLAHIELGPHTGGGAKPLELLARAK